jgi:hypothetical protein
VQENVPTDAANDCSPDRRERIRDFLDRHGGPAAVPSVNDTAAEGSSGWSEVYAADGFKLRCDWSEMGDRTEMQFVEIPP